MQQNKNLLKNDNERWHPLGLRACEGKTDLLLMDNACLCLLSSKLHLAIMIFVFSLIAFQIYATDIATQCPLIGGPAVYLARPIVELFDENIIYNDAAVCLSQGVSMKLFNGNLQTQIIEKSNVNVYPIPSKDLVNFDFRNNQFNLLIIFDTFGKQMQEVKLDAKHQYILQTNLLANGIYRYKLLNDEYELTGKIVILK